MWNKRVLVSFKALSGNSLQELSKSMKSSARLVGVPSTSPVQVKYGSASASNDTNLSGKTKRNTGKAKSKLQLNL